jgi:hypothetical protein
MIRGETCLLEVEKDGVKAEKHESDTSNQPTEGLVLQGMSVHPRIQAHPVIDFSDGMTGRRNSQEESNQRSSENKRADSLCGPIEAVHFDELLGHYGINQTGCIGCQYSKKKQNRLW